MNTFNVGNMIRGKAGNPGNYTYTTDQVVMRVDEVVDERHVNVIIVGQISSYMVMSCHFTLERGYIPPPPPPTTEDVKSLPKRILRMKGEWKEAMELVANSNILKPNTEVEYASLIEEGTYKAYQNQPCHGALRNGKVGTQFVVSTIYAEQNPLTRWFYRWLLNDSPYRYIIMNRSVTDIFKRGLIVRADVPSNYMLGCLITSRYARSKLEYVDLMRKLVSSGYDGNRAFIYCHMFKSVKNGEGEIGYVLNNRQDETTSIQWSYIDAEFIKNFTSSTFSNPSPNYQDTGIYRNVYGLWSGDGPLWSYTPDSVDPIIPQLELNISYSYLQWNETQTEERVSSYKSVLASLKEAGL